MLRREDGRVVQSLQIPERALKLRNRKRAIGKPPQSSRCWLLAASGATLWWQQRHPSRRCCLGPIEKLQCASGCQTAQTKLEVLELWHAESAGVALGWETKAHVLVAPPDETAPDAGASGTKREEKGTALARSGGSVTHAYVEHMCPAGREALVTGEIELRLRWSTVPGGDCVRGGGVAAVPVDTKSGEIFWHVAWACLSPCHGFHCLRA